MLKLRQNIIVYSHLVLNKCNLSDQLVEISIFVMCFSQISLITSANVQTVYKLGKLLIFFQFVVQCRAQTRNNLIELCCGAQNVLIGSCDVLLCRKMVATCIPCSKQNVALVSSNAVVAYTLTRMWGTNYYCGLIKIFNTNA